MSAWKKIPHGWHALILAALVLPALAADKPDLDRVTPVPADQPIPIVDFFRLRTFSAPRLNPSGTFVAALVSGEDDKRQLLAADLKTQKVELLGGNGDKDITHFAWLNDHRLIYSFSTQKLYGLGLLAADLGDFGHSYPLIQYYGARLIAVPHQNGTRPLVWLSHDSLETRKDLGVAVINTDIQSGGFINLVAAGANRSLAVDARNNNDKHIVQTYPIPDGGIGSGYLADKEGNLEFAFTEQGGLFTMQRLAGDTWEKCPIDLETIDVVGCGDQPGELVVLGPRQEGKPRLLQFMDGATGRLGDVLLQDPAYEFHGWLYRDPVSRQVVGADYDRNGPRTVWFNEDYRRLQQILDGFFPGLVVRILQNNTAGTLFLVETFSDRQPPVYHWVDLATRKAGKINDSAPWIDPKRMRPMSVIKFKTKDGPPLDAYLTLPASASKQHPVPLVVLPHGGPWVRDTWGFNGEVQFLASRGYAVLQPNYRGSPGYDWMFPVEDRYDFLKMHDDVTAATKTAIATGLVDPARVAIMGGSFGGYLALSGVVHEPSLYRCAVTIAGVFNWDRLMQQEKFYQYDSPVFARLSYKLGDPKKQTEKFEAISPVRHVDQIRVPLFVSHGQDDPVADIEQSRELVSELEKFHVPHETLFVGGEGHGMGHLDNRIELYSRIETFLAKNLAPVPAPSP